jgi:hypothetical protein
MPMLQTLLGELNVAFSKGRIPEIASGRDKFSLGEPLEDVVADIVAKAGTVDYRAAKAYVHTLPPSIQETLRGVIHYALSTEPPTLITFAWAPAYDFEATVWQAPDTAETRGGITILVKSRYPADPHPLA